MHGARHFVDILPARALRANGGPLDFVGLDRGHGPGSALAGVGARSRDGLPERLVQRDQLAPRALGLRSVVERRAILDRHVGHAPAVPCRIDLDFHWDARLREALLQLVLCVGLSLIVVGRDAEVHARLDLRREKVRAVWLVGYEPASVEGRAGADALWNRRGRPHDKWAAHAVALSADL